ncbi:type II secretion system protein GspL [Thiothrix nivea]|uniref:Type II secretion system protein L n=1 Tax=Thiothrix nivea (strain ATCC 35100 / DSM 5205 / JP2) TaxID=870187 RepID=A0A656HJL1_THINJ|nr:type II secretion system protein GspL [Thiothrix nivea]EIJ35195.1 general secretion pathway protein L [Thiothrix nivea DSM 5205]
MLVIRLQSPNDPEPAWASLGNTATNWTHGSWETLLPLARGQELVLLIPAREVLLTQTNVNTRNQRQLQQAIPFALEDSIAADLEDQHIVWQTRPASTLVDVAIIQRDRLRAWGSALHERQLRARYILPDLFALPWEADSTTLWQQGEQVWVRTGELSGYASSARALPLLLDGMAEGQAAPPRLRLYTDKTADWAADPRFSIQPETQAEQLLPASLQPALKLNLLNGLQDENRAHWRQQWQRWRLPAALAASAALLAVGIYGSESYRLQQQLDALDESNLRLFSELFPEASGIDPRGLKNRLASELTRLGGQQADSTTPSHLPQLASFAAALNTTGGLTVEDIRAQTGTLTINLQAQNQQAIETLRDTLEQALGNPVELQSSRTADSVKATLTLGGNS